MAASNNFRFIAAGTVNDNNELGASGSAIAMSRTLHAREQMV